MDFAVTKQLLNFLLRFQCPNCEFSTLEAVLIQKHLRQCLTKDNDEFVMEHVEEEFKTELDIKDELIESDFLCKVPLEKIKIEKLIKKDPDEVIGDTDNVLSELSPFDDPDNDDSDNDIPELSPYKDKVKIEEHHLQQPQIEAVLCGEPAEILHEMEDDDMETDENIDPELEANVEADEEEEVEKGQEHDNDDKKDWHYQCDNCQKTYKYKFKTDSLARCVRCQNGFINLKSKVRVGWTCTYCLKDFEILAHMHTHIEKEHHGLRYKCKHCGRHFKDKSKAVKNNHNCFDEQLDEDIFSCQYCDNSYLEKQYLLEHLNYDHIKCAKNKCSEMLQVKRGTVQKQNPLCPKCKTKKEAKPKGLVACQYCKNTYKTQAAMFRHIDADHLESAYMCLQCKTPFATKSGKMYHPCYNTFESTQNFENRAKNTCNICEKTYPNQENFLKHFKYIHQVTQKVKCKFCDIQFESKEKLLVHVEDLHLKMTKGKGLIACRKCDNTYPNRKNVLKHINFCHKDRPFWN